MRTLIIDDDRTSAERLRLALRQRGLEAEIVALDPLARAEALASPFDLIFTELAHEPEEAIAPIIEAQAFQPDSQVLVYTSRPDLQSSIEALRQGAVDYLIKGIDEGLTLGNAIERAVIRRGLLAEKEGLLTALSEANDRLGDLANRDGLTGLYNARFFAEYSAKALDRARRQRSPLAVLMTDIDFFKKVNDTYGHLVGDDVLREYGQRLTRSIRGSDLVARYGGEEFIILLPDTPLAGAQQVAEKLRQVIAETPFTSGDVSISITMSAGIATFPTHADSIERLVSLADAALYRAKAHGRNRFEWAA